MSNEVKVIVPATNTTPEKKFKVSVKNNSGGPGMMAAITAAANKAVAAIAPQPAPQPPNNSMRVVPPESFEGVSPLQNEENANLSEGGRRRRNKRKGTRRNKRKGTRRNKRKGTCRNKRN